MKSEAEMNSASLDYRLPLRWGQDRFFRMSVLERPASSSCDGDMAWTMNQMMLGFRGIIFRSIGR